MKKVVKLSQSMAIFDELKSVAKTLREADKIEQYQQILDVQERLLEMQKRIADLEVENGVLKEKLKIKEGLIFERNAYWLPEGDKKDGPFCSKCKDGEDKLVRMRVGDYTFGWAHCPNCGKTTP